MKTIVTAIIVAVFVVFPSLCFASYVIHLKSGHSFQTDRYWEEGGEIKFERYGGVVGVRKDLVQEIEEIEDLPEEKEAAAKPEVPTAKAKAGKQEATEEKKPVPSTGKETKADGSLEKKLPKTPDKPATAGGDRPEEGPDLEVYRTEYLDLKARHKEAKKRYWKARRAKYDEAKKAALAEIKTLSQEMEDLKNQVKEENKGAVPEWWK